MNISLAVAEHTLGPLMRRGTACTMLQVGPARHKWVVPALTGRQACTPVAAHRDTGPPPQRRTPPHVANSLLACHLDLWRLQNTIDPDRLIRLEPVCKLLGLLTVPCTDR